MTTIPTNLTQKEEQVMKLMTAVMVVMMVMFSVVCLAGEKEDLLQQRQISQSEVVKLQVEFNIISSILNNVNEMARSRKAEFELRKLELQAIEQKIGEIQKAEEASKKREVKPDVKK